MARRGGGYQPYGKGGNGRPGPAKRAMKRGRTATGYHPMDAKRTAQRRRRRKTRANLYTSLRSAGRR